MSKDQPIFVSRPHPRSLWNSYFIYSDRLEMQAGTIGCIRIPLAQIEEVAIRPPLVVLDVFRGRLPVRFLMRSLKIDLCDFATHLMVCKDTGYWRQYRFTPEDVGAFRDALERAIREGDGERTPGKSKRG